MSPSTAMFLVFFFIPMGFIFTIWLPFYMSVWSALYLVYEAKHKAINPMLALKYEATITMEQYWKMLQFWWHHYDTLNPQTVTLPLLGLPALGMVISLGFGVYYARYIRRMFTVDDD